MAYLAQISVHYPDQILTNEELVQNHESWTADKVFQKLGIKERRVVQKDEYATDLACEAVQNLVKNGVDLSDVDFLLYCTQSPDYLIPGPASLLHDRLKLKKNVGALDFNLGCSGYVYGLGLAAGLIDSGQANKLLFVTAETYSRFISDDDISNRLMFGDAATCSLITSSKIHSDSLKIGRFAYGSDGSGWPKLTANFGGLKAQETTPKRALYMDGPAVMAFAMREVPEVLNRVLFKNDLADAGNIDHFVFHQANKFLLDQLERKLNIPPSKLHRQFESWGNTVSNTLPIVIHDLQSSHKIKPQQTVALVGFGVGFSWAGTILSS